MAMKIDTYKRSLLKDFFENLQDVALIVLLILLGCIGLFIIASTIKLMFGAFGLFVVIIIVVIVIGWAIIKTLWQHKRI